MQEAHAMSLTSASLSLLQKRHRKRGFDHVASYVAEQAAYPPGQSGDENVETDNPASPRKSSIILLGEEAAGPSRSAAQGHIQPKETWSKCDRKSDESPGPALTLTAKTVSRKRQRYDSSLISPIKENNAEDGIRYGSETTYVSWSTSSGRKPADTSRVTAAREVFERGKRHKMHESRQKPASTSKKKENQSGKKKKGKAKEPRLPQPAFGVLASSAVESEHLSGARLTVRPRITTGLFHKGRISRLKSRTALPDLTFCEMDFLRNGPSESRPAQQAREGKKGDGKRRTECDTNEEISSFFKRAASPPRNENTDPLPSRAKHHAAPPEVREKSKQSNSQLENHPTASHYKILTSREYQPELDSDIRDKRSFLGSSVHPQHLADGLNDRFTFEQPIRDDKITTDDHPMLYQAGFPASGSEHAYPPKGNLWSNLMGAAQISLGSDQDRSREAETTSLYFNNGGSVAEECEYQATRGKRRGGPDIDSYDGYTNFDNNLEENGMYEGGDLDGLGCPIVGENANADLQSEQDQAPHVRNSTSEMPQLGPKNFWRPHRLY
ncbi:hypothetical protein TWF788_007084 [Orbilia oligospora]|uniref:Uncharacterized protein n=1 Tax=Orbilia oligospora TaxID=2813651 RepID=A0A7C8TSM9_ORBOL|nr:hypothetical protein TWF788_007084 [Orbilia oligospora]